MKKFTKIIPLLTLLAVFFSPEMALANTIKEFEGPLEKFLDTFSGPVGFSIICLAAIGLAFSYIFSKQDLDGLMGPIAKVAVVGCLILFVSSILTFVYGNAFSSGALL